MRSPFAVVRGALARRHAERTLAQLSAPAFAPAAATVLVDGIWDNPNHWARYALIRAALGLARSREIGITGPWNGARVGRTLRRLGVREVVSFPALADRPSSNTALAREMLGATRRADDVLQWQLPHGVPADLIYDGLLKRQRLGTVDVSDRRLSGFVTEALDCITAAERLLDASRFDLLVVSHPCNFIHAALLWLALKRGIPALLVLGTYGTLRLTRLREPGDVYRFVDTPSRAEMDGLPPDRRERLEKLGLAYLERRLAGQTSDASAVQAFGGRSVRMDRAALARAFNWDPSLPIVAVYAPNWFDYPHGTGLSTFRDYQDWIQTTVREARENRRVNWLFKRHPWDARYGGVTLADVAPAIESASNMRSVPDAWNGAALVDQVDGLITCQGTAAIEYASVGRPVLLAHQGWYDHAGFAMLAGSQADYLAALRREWWREVDTAEASRRARLFAGFYFGHPAWQAPFLLSDDTTQWTIYESLPALLARAKPVVEREVATIREWYDSGSRAYHTYKMLCAEEYSF